MTADFTHLKALEVSEGKTTMYTLHQLKGAPKLRVAPATPDNKPYFNEVLKKTRSKQPARVKRITNETISENRDEDKESFVKFIVKGWEGVKDTSGKLVPFNEENLRGFLKALPDWIFDDMREFVSDITNFVEFGDDEATIKN